MDDRVTPLQFIVFLFALFCSGVLASVYWYWMFESGPVAWALAFARFVKRLLTPPVSVMSSAQQGAPAVVSSVSQTDRVQTPDQTENPAARRAKLLDTYRVLRRLGMNRDDARALLKPWGIPLDNNLWAQVAPETEEPAVLTPIAGRPTNARFHDDPNLIYQPPD